MNSLMLCLLTETIIRLLQGTYASPMAPASSTAHQSAMDELFDRIIAYIDDNIYDPLTIPEICEHFSLSRSALQLLFKNSVDQSPKSISTTRSWSAAVRCSSRTAIPSAKFHCVWATAPSIISPSPST